ncbi:Uncharacterized protein family UPF0136 [Macleaya cordata]|uniref:Uncharacterized protein family UPF0136 n=1 Tax=Macleaya cordata TaxID=56857 RepID=A0A200QNQ8_MACCD|nr:Uncharacterized protein family UPF0136 [Macleaya cordata]
MALLSSARVCSQSSLLLPSSSSSDLLPISGTATRTLSWRGKSPTSISFTFSRTTNRPLTSLIEPKSRRLDRIFKVEAATEQTNQQVQLDNSGGDGFGGSSGGGGGGGGGGDNNNGNNNNNEGEEGDLNNKKKMAMSMSQKLTLGYAALVGVGGVMGYIKSGSQKSLAAGGISASLLYYVYTQLPTKPAFASSLGLGLSAALLVVMGSRFKKSGKIFPAGVVSFVSLVMTGGYLHGVMRSVLHA